MFWQNSLVWPNMYLVFFYDLINSVKFSMSRATYIFYKHVYSLLMLFCTHMGTIEFSSDFTRSAHQTEDPSVGPNNLCVLVLGSRGDSHVSRKTKITRFVPRLPFLLLSFRAYNSLVDSKVAVVIEIRIDQDLAR